MPRASPDRLSLRTAPSNVLVEQGRPPAPAEDHLAVHEGASPGGLQNRPDRYVAVVPLDRLVERLLHLDSGFPHLKTARDGRARGQITYARGALRRLKKILQIQAVRGRLADAVQLQLPWMSAFVGPGAIAGHGQRFYYVDHSSAAVRELRERRARETVGNRCQLCYSPPDECAPLVIHERSGDLDVPRRLTVLCSKCPSVFAQAGRLQKLSGEITIADNEYNPDAFDASDMSTWLMISSNTVSIAWAEDFGLTEWSDYCPECGYTVLDSDIQDPAIVCVGCGHTSISGESSMMRGPQWGTDLPDDTKLAEVHPYDQEEYAEYLKSKKWQERRGATQERDGGSCIICNSSSDLAVHHRTYVRRYEEHPEDLVTLCQPCHDLFHLRLVAWGSWDPAASTSTASPP
jgi:hypothetical protein